MWHVNADPVCKVILDQEFSWGLLLKLGAGTRSESICHSQHTQVQACGGQGLPGSSDKSPMQSSHTQHPIHPEAMMRSKHHSHCTKWAAYTPQWKRDISQHCTKSHAIMPTELACPQTNTGINTCGHDRTQRASKLTAAAYVLPPESLQEAAFPMGLLKSLE